MYLSYLLINTGENPDRQDWRNRNWLRNLYRVHQRLCMAFPSKEQKKNDPQFLKPYNPNGFQHVHGPRTPQQAFLFRIDPQPGASPIIVVQSAIKPDWEYAFHNAEYLLAAKPEVRPFDPNFQKNQKLKFRLLVNAVRRASKRSLDARGNPINENWYGKRIPVPYERLPEWLAKKGEKAGFQIERLDLIQTGYVYIKGHKKHQKHEKNNEQEDEEKQSNRLFSVRFEGTLKVTNPDNFRNTLIRGIGPAKAFGFGLLTVRPLK